MWGWEIKGGLPTCHTCWGVRGLVACIWCEALFDRSEVFHTGLSFAAVGGRRLSGTSLRPVDVRLGVGRWGPERDDLCLFYYEAVRLEIWRACGRNIVLFCKTCRLCMLHILSDLLDV